MSAIVETASGRVAGFEETPGVWSFRGIPFARPPVGARRFGPPEPAEPWTGVRPSAFGGAAPQPASRIPLLPATDPGEMDEDCLYLNVWTPGPGSARRPVLVWIHGGGFTTGAGSRPMYTESPLPARGDVVLVTINYRLGALGFLYLAELGGERIDAVANPGLLDQIAALRWVRENIAAFGGDPANVTVFGESAGGMSVGVLLGAPAAQGLFARAVAQSGAAHNLHDPATATGVARAVLGELGLGPESLDKLREVPALDLLAAQQRVVDQRTNSSFLLPFQPVQDGRLLPEPPLDALRGGLARGVPLLVGTTRDEWKLFSALDSRNRDLTLSGVEQRVERAFPGRGAALVETYRAARSARGASVEPRELLDAIQTDRMFRIPAVRLAEAQQPHADTYMYLFDWESPAVGGRLGSCHALEVPFVFGTLRKPGMSSLTGSGPEPERLAEHMMDAWLAFARHGRPAHPSLPEWPGYEPARRATVWFGAEIRRGDDPLAAERRAWDGVL